ncbi:MAG: bifunctional phosphopantothenoylcysteine decarboxylase/phosphopantothenate--cysteine ligase CoaBC [Selenomonadaceae bacterium]|nr:bifunctional phosphopantothenoylcysteine decarboxylase/phosphopantothenate--cysteine ligase CoaBC [Selenomonadaceae bacterium]
MSEFEGKHILLGVTGGIAAYKAIEIASRIKKEGGLVDVILTKGATNFVTPLSFGEVLGRKVYADLWENQAEPIHIRLAENADLVLIAPATANFIAKTANGMADDLLSTTMLAVKSPIVVAPAMNTNMLNNPVTSENISKLKSLGMRIIPPAEGILACGAKGAGRLPEPTEIVEFARSVLSNTKRTLSGKKIVVTAGGTIAPIDPVRFIGNRSTGKMGFAIAKEAVSRGANVVLVTGISHLKDVQGAKTVRVETTEEMRTAVLAEYDNADAVIKSAAVADYRLEEVATEKIKKKDGEFVLKLVRNPDILKELGKKKKNQILVGFAAETEKLTEYANKKLVEKNLDFIVANNVKSEGAGFGTDTNIAKLMFRDGRVIDAPIMEKSELAKIILDEVESLMK